MPGDWEKQWKNDKTRFEGDTGKKKPSQKFLGVFRLGTGIESALRTCDATFKAAGSPGKIEDRKKAIGRFEAAIKVYEKAQADYQKILASSMEKGDEQVKPFVDVLVKELKAILATMLAQLKVLRVAVEAETSEMTMLDKTARILVSSVQGAVQRALAFAALVKSKGTPDAFNGGIVKAARDITQFIGNVEKLQQQGYNFVDNPKNIFTVMTPWAQGNRKLKPTETKEHVLREIGAFVQVVEGVNKWVAKQP